MPLPEIAFGQWRLGKSASNHTFLKDPVEDEDDKPPTASKRLIAREDMMFKESYDIVNQDDILLQGEDLRRALLLPHGKNKDGEETWKFITEAQFVERGLRARCDLCFDHLSNRMRYHEEHFRCHPKTGFQFSTSALFPEVDWDLVPEQLEERDIRDAIHGAINDPSAAFGDFDVRAEAKNSNFEERVVDAHARYYGQRGLNLVDKWIRTTFRTDFVDVSPLSVDQFLDLRLLPFAIDQLVAEDQHLSIPQARDLRTRSCHIGLIRDQDQPLDSDDEGNGSSKDENEEMEDRGNDRNEADRDWMDAVRRDAAGARVRILAEGRKE